MWSAQPHSLDGRAPALAPESSSRGFFVIPLLSKVNSGGIFSFIVENKSVKMENRRIAEVEGKGVSKDVSVTVNQAFN